MRYLIVAVVLVLFAVACGTPEESPQPAEPIPAAAPSTQADEAAVPAEAQRSRGLPACDPDNGGLILPEGFCALVVADGLEGARHLDVTADGDIYVHLRGSRGREPDPPGGRCGRAPGCRW